MPNCNMVDYLLSISASDVQRGSLSLHLLFNGVTL